MSCAIVSVIYGVPLNERVSKKIRAWEDGSEDVEGEDSKWFETNGGVCGFETRYSASGSELIGFCGVELCELESYGNQKLSSLKLEPTESQKAVAVKKVSALHPELQKLAGSIDVYLIWHDS